MARRPSGGTRFRRRWSDPGVTKCQHQRAPKRSTARARACAAISSRFLGDVVVVSESINRLAIFATSSIARLNAASFAFDGALNPLSFRTNCSEAARISSSVAGGSKLKRVLMLRHMGRANLPPRPAAIEAQLVGTVGAQHEGHPQVSLAPRAGQGRGGRREGED